MIPTKIATPTVDAAVQLGNGASVSASENESCRVEDLILRRTRPNVLLVGPLAEVDRTFGRLHPYLRMPVTPWVPIGMPYPPTSRGTLVIQGVDGLSGVQQARLLAAIDRTPPDIQVVSIARAPLFPLVQRGIFLDRLYYRLNVVYLDLTATPGH